MRLVGRDVDLDVLGQLLRDAHTSSAVLTLVGIPGIGKSSLLDALVARAIENDVATLRCGPTELERHLPGAALGDLLATFTDLSGLDEGPRAALDQALLRGASNAQPVDVRMVGVGLVALLERHTQLVGPLLMVADDLHWFDPLSASVLAFAARRLPATGVVLAAARRQDDEAIDLGGSEHLLRPLSDDALLAVLTERTAAAHPKPGARLLREALVTAGGNPLYAVELARSLVTRAADSDRLVIPPTLEAAIERRLAQTSSTRRAALATVALLARPDLATVRRLGLIDDVAAAEVDELVDTRSGRVVFAHPLFPAVLRQQLPAMNKRAIHARLADVVDAEEERVRHSALAAEGADAELARRLVGAAHDAERRGAVENAADLAAHAARLTPLDDGDGATRSITAARLVYACGDTDGAVAWLDDGVARRPTAADRVRELCVRTAIAFDTGNGSPASFASEALRWCTTDVERIEVEALLARVIYEDFPLAAKHAARAAELAEHTDVPPSIRVGVLLAVAGTSFIAGQGLNREIHQRAIEIERGVSLITAESACGSFAALLKMADELDESRAMFLRLLAETDDEGTLPYALSHLPQLELWAGNWDRAEDYAQQHLEAALRTGQHDQVTQARTNLATIGAHRGELAEAVSLATEIAATSRAASGAWGERSGVGLLGFAALSDGDATAAAGHLDRFHELSDQMGILDPGYCRMDGDHVEALVAVGRLDDAARRCAEMRTIAERLGRERAIGVVDRVSALVAAARDDRASALSLGKSAVERLASGPFVFEHARAQLTLGQIHRRFKEKAAARESLDAALATFERLGADRFAARARQDLERIGSRPATAFALTATELRVAAMAADGATVKSIGAELFISPKTVEANLTRVYRKLGISGRAQLARWYAAQPPVNSG